MKITDEAVKVMAEYLAEAHSGRLWDQYTAETRELLIENYLPTARVALVSALPHLEGATPVADKTGYNALAPWLEEVFSSNEEGVTWEDAAKALFECGAVREGATPAIDREAIRREVAEEIASEIERCALTLATENDETGNYLTAAILQKAADIARTTAGLGGAS